MNIENPYQAYLEGSVLSENPMSLVVKLYDGAVAALRRAQTCLETGDVMGRGKAVNQTINILMELLTSLDFERGGEVSKNLRELYCYLQARVLDGHIKKAIGPFQEAETLLVTLLDGWRQASSNLISEPADAVPAGEPEALPETCESYCYAHLGEVSYRAPTLCASF